MKIISSHCDNCGAPLEIPVRARRVTCLFCESVLDVIRTDSVVTTQVIEELRSRIEKTERDLQSIEVREQLRRYDESWAQYRRTFRAHKSEGRVTTKGEAEGMILFGGAIMILGVLVFAFVPPVGAPLLALGIAPLLVGLILRPDAIRYQRARGKFVMGRRRLSEKLKELREDAAPERS